MTDPSTDEPKPADLPPVDAMIHEAREGSWHLPDTEPGPERAAVDAPEPPGPLRSAPRDTRPAAPSPGPAAAHRTPAAPEASGAATAAQVSTTAHAPEAQAAATVHAPEAHVAADAHGAPGGHGGATTHGSGHDDAHGHETLGPVDVQMWGAGIVATAIGLFMAACFVLATSGVGAY